MKNFATLGLATLIVILNAIFGHYFAPGGIMMTPIILIITTSLVCFQIKNIGAIFISVLAFLFIALNDIGIKLYAGGTHDNEGLAWVHLLLFAGLIPSFGILLAAIFRHPSEKLYIKIISILLFVGLVAIHLQLFSTLGLGRDYNINWNV